MFLRRFIGLFCGMAPSGLSGMLRNDKNHLHAETGFLFGDDTMCMDYRLRSAWKIHPLNYFKDKQRGKRRNLRMWQALFFSG